MVIVISLAEFVLVSLTWVYVGNTPFPLTLRTRDMGGAGPGRRLRAARRFDPHQRRRRLRLLGSRAGHGRRSAIER